MSDLESVMNRLRSVSGGGLAEFYAKEELAVLEAAEQRIKELEEAIKRAKPLLRHDSTSAKCFEAIQVLASVVK